jgi:hypothetical protein
VGHEGVNGSASSRQGVVEWGRDCGWETARVWDSGKGRRRLRLRGCSSEVRVLRENYEYIGPLSGVVLIDKCKSAIAAKQCVLLVLTKLTALCPYLYKKIKKKKKTKLTALVSRVSR